MKRLAILTALGLALAACSPDPVSIDGSWLLVEGSWNDQEVPILEEHPITLDIDGDHISGAAACNSYGGDVAIDNGSFETSAVFQTEMACLPEEVMEAETIYLGALQMVETSSLDDGRLVLSGPDTELVFERLEPVPTADLVGTVWVLDGLIQGDAVSSVTGERATLELFTDGSLIGSTGCRDITGSYVIGGGAVQVTELKAEGECPEDLVDQDSRVISALEGGFRVEIDGDRMTTWVAGDEGLAYRADS